MFICCTLLVQSIFCDTGMRECNYLTETYGLQPLRRFKRSKRPVGYYSNSTATQKLLMAGDIEKNPGPQNHSCAKHNKWKAPRCTICEKFVAKNHKRLVCDVCYDFTHAGCSKSIFNLKSCPSATPMAWTCSKCSLSSLPFYDTSINDPAEHPQINSVKDTTEDVHLQSLNDKSNQLKIMHINTQSMVSTFDNLLIAIERYFFDIITMSETWLKENSLLLQHVTIPGYVHEFNNRDKVRGGGVGIYIKDSIKCKRRSDIEARYTSMEHLWVEIPGRNKNSKLLLGTFYRSETLLSYSNWLDNFESLLSELTLSWDGLLLLTGDFNVDLLRQDKPTTKKYQDVLAALSLQQLVSKSTRTTLHSTTLIDHIITNSAQQVTHTDVLPCPLISDICHCQRSRHQVCS